MNIVKFTLETHKPLVFVLDDEVEITELLHDELGEDYQVMAFNSPQKLIQTLEQNTLTPAVLVTDLKMPEMTGLEVLAKIKKMGKNIPTLMFSGYLQKDDAVKALELGVVHILEKPVDVTMVHEMVNATFVDYQLYRTHSELLLLTKKISEMYSVMRLSIQNLMPPEIVKKIFLEERPNGQAVSIDDFEKVVDELESKVQQMIKLEESLLMEKQNIFKKAASDL